MLTFEFNTHGIVCQIKVLYNEDLVYLIDLRARLDSFRRIFFGRIDPVVVVRNVEMIFGLERFLL